MLGIWMVRQEAEPLGIHLQQHLGGVLMTPWAEHTPPKDLFKKVFVDYSEWVLIMTTGIAVRYLDGLIQSKHTDPAVVVLDEGGRYAVSLLSGHEGGANGLAYQVANVTGALPVITTATESLKPLIMGIGCRKGITRDQIESAVQEALKTIQRRENELREVATIDLKIKEPGLVQWCAEKEIPLHSIPQTLVRLRPWVTQPSDWVKQNIGVDGVCEPCALLASVRGQLILKKMAYDGVAVAVVEDPAWTV